MAVSNIFIAVIWVLFLSGAFVEGLAMPHMGPLPPVVEKQAAFIVLFPFAVGLPLAFFQRRRYAFDVPWIRKLVDSKWGSGTYDGFFARLRPVALFMLTCLILGVTGMASTVATTQSFSAYVQSGLFLSAGLGLLAAYLLSIRFPPRLE
jgi:hypothetical protein